MNNDNLAFLLENLKYLGFGEQPGLYDQLREVITQEPTEFQLETEYYFEEQCKLETILYFRRSNRSDLYFFNRYEARLYYPDDQDRNRQQTFYISKGRGVTFKEAFNLLQGRAVYKRLISKDGDPYYAWIQLNFEEKDLNQNYRTRQYYPGYGYDLEKLLERYPIRELQLPQLRENLLKSLRKGNMATVSFTKPHKVEKMLIEACPQFKTITIYRPAIKPAEDLADHSKMEWEKVPAEADSGDEILWDNEEEHAGPEGLNYAEEGGDEGADPEMKGSSPEKTVAKKRATPKKISL